MGIFFIFVLAFYFIVFFFCFYLEINLPDVVNRSNSQRDVLRTPTFVKCPTRPPISGSDLQKCTSSPNLSSTSRPTNLDRYTKMDFILPHPPANLVESSNIIENGLMKTNQIVDTNQNNVNANNWINRMSKKQNKTVQHLDKLTQINIHLHGMLLCLFLFVLFFLFIYILYFIYIFIYLIQESLNA